MFRFYADSMLGKLSRFLRFLGYDTLYRTSESVEEMLRESKQNARVVLSRSRQVISLCTKLQIPFIYLTSTDISKQLQVIKESLSLEIFFPPKTMRCSLCNGDLVSREKKEILGRIPAGTTTYYDEFWECSKCSQIFWMGSHWDDIKRIIDAE